MKKNVRLFLGVLGIMLIFGFVLIGCDNGSTTSSTNNSTNDSTDGSTNDDDGSIPDALQATWYTDIDCKTVAFTITSSKLIQAEGTRLDIRVNGTTIQVRAPDWYDMYTNYKVEGRILTANNPHVPGYVWKLYKK